MKFTVSLSFFVLLKIAVFAQNKVDSLKQVIAASDDPNTKIETLTALADQFQNPNDKIVYARQSYRLSETATNKSKIMAANQMGVCHGMLGQIDSSKYYFNKSLEASLASGDSAYISSAYNGLGNLSRITANLEQSLENFLSALDYADAVPNRKWYADILTNISGVYFELKNYEAALVKVLEARAIYEELDDNQNISYSANLLAIVYRALGEFDKAYQYNQEALEMLLISNDTTQIIYNYVNTTEILIENGELNKAAENALKAIELAEKFGDRDPQISSLITLSSIYFRQGKINLAKKYVDRGIEVSMKYNFKSQLPNAYMMQSLIESAKGNHGKSYDWIELREAVNDSIRSKEVSDRISELSVQYETEKKENEIERLSADQEIRELELEQAQTRNLLLGIIAVLFILIGSITYYLYRQRIRINNQLRAVNKTKDKLFSMIAHDIKNPLSAFKAIAHALEENYKSMPEDEVDLFISQLDTTSNKLLDLLQNLLEWSITESGNLRFNPEKIKLKSIVDETTELFQGAIDAKMLNVKNEVPADVEVYADYKMLFSVIRNLISNAIKFTKPKGNISIKTKLVDQLLEVSVIDNGKGMTGSQLENIFKKDSITDKDGTGLGLIICKEFVEKNGGRMSVESKDGSGTTFKFTLKPPQG
ncbi:Signal transduction histidine kinase [Ekhidna lutea]|uniref:histidine kinase n=1 Tax=Ekhidna lutea TaxID=447679 RepID=A0A239KM20_EKHLU|nr:tetratricopeptide repeat protein [Ekhidna lutea]SNT18639.1 Signal transduction histidine kinase [Ekhidna lutea]